MNKNIRFGRILKPIELKDVFKGGVSIMFDKMSPIGVSANITVGSEPFILKAFGLKPDEKIEVYNTFSGTDAKMYYNGEEIALTESNNVVLLPISGVYKLKTDAVLGDLVCIAYPQSYFDPDTAKSVSITNPNGPQKNRPNVFFDGMPGRNLSTKFFVANQPWVFRAYGLVDQEIRLRSLFEGNAEQVVEAGQPVAIDLDDNTLIVHITGGYDFELIGDSTNVRLVGNPTALNISNPYLKQGEPGPPGPPGTGTGINFVQAVPSNEWTINHNLGYNPSVELFTVGGAEFEADVVHTSINQTKVYIAAAIAGSARLN